MCSLGAGFYYINLDRDRPRMLHMEACASCMGLRFQRVAASDLRDLGAAPPREFRPFSHRNEKWTLRPFELAVFDSHRRAWKAFLAGSHEVGVIMEDDLLFGERFPATIASLCGISERFDIARLNHSVQTRRLGPARTDIPDMSLHPILENMADAGCYAVTRRAAGELLAQSEVFCSHLDDFVFSPDRRLRILQMLPPVCSQVIHRTESIGAGSDFNISSRVAQQTTAPKGPLSFRILKEVRRISKRIKWSAACLAAGGARVDLQGYLRGFQPLREGASPTHE